MELIEYEEGIIYAVKWPEQEFDEYERLIDYAEPACVHQFIEQHQWEISQYYVNKLKIPRDRVDKWVKHITKEGEKLLDRLDQLIDNTIVGTTPDLFQHFKIIEGYESRDKPAMKSYGPDDPSMLRVYAIEIEQRCWIIFYSGIKIGKNFSDSPGLEVVKDKANQVIAYLETNGVISLDDLKTLV